MSPGRNPPHGNAEPFYTNEDVAVLHNIVLLAEELLPNLPERERLPTNALFSAYYDILPRVGVNADHDSRYARILFKIGGLRGTGTIYEKFEEILSKMGIEIEFDAEEEVLSQSEESQADVESMEQEVLHNARGRRRRNSESSAWDLGTGLTQPSRGRASSVSSLRKPSPPRNATGEVSLQDSSAAQRQAGDATTDVTKEENISSKHNFRTWLASGQESRKERQRSVSRHSNLQIRRRSPSSTQNRSSLARRHSTGSDDFLTTSEITAVTSAEERQALDSLELFQENQLNKASASLMHVKASVILQHHLSFLAKHQLRLWRDKALQLREDNINLGFLASQHDKKVLLQLGLETWLDRLRHKRQIAEAERFFAYFERRASRARDLYLLQKAFTHWRHSAYDEVERTSVARRHIIRTRTFNSWRDITAVNELKVRRHIIKKFFSSWRRQHLTIRANDVTALQKFEENLVEKAYQKWLRKCWHIKAVIWWAEGAKQRMISRWSSILRNVLTDKDNAEEIRRLQLLWRTWQIWRTRNDERLSMHRQANNFYLFHACSSALKRWRGEARVIPAKIALQTDVSSRLLRDAFVLWQHRSRQERQAVAIDCLRIYREAWTTWRHKVRFQVLRLRIDDRVIKEAIYKWILNERVVLSNRNLDQRLLQTSLPNWVQKWRITRKQRWDQEDIAQDFAIRKARSRLLSLWHVRMVSQRICEIDVADEYISKLLRQLLSQWSNRTHQLQKLDQWSRDAKFYFFASKFLKRWKASTESAKREKRKAAYTRVRRMAKMNLAQGVLLGWRQQAQRILELQTEAQQMCQNKIVIVGMNIFDRWRARAEELGELEFLWREKVLKKHFIAWKDRSSAFKDLEVEALVNYQERQQGRTVKAWSLFTLKLRSRLHYAAEIREKNLKRTFRKTFSYWHQRTLQKRPVIRAEPLEANRQDQLGVTARAETWSDFGDENEADEWVSGLNDIDTSTPVPGYLSTPSKRMERVTAAAARFSSTTPRAPLSTPFERHLRAQYSGGQFSSIRRAPGRSQLGMGGGGFANISDRDKYEKYDST